MRRSTVLIVALAALLGASAAPALADHVAPHQHEIVLPDGSTRDVGPPICSNPEVAGGHDNFHENVHMGNAQGGFDQPNNPVDLTATGC